MANDGLLLMKFDIIDYSLKKYITMEETFRNNWKITYCHEPKLFMIQIIVHIFSVNSQTITEFKKNNDPPYLYYYLFYIINS